MNHYILATCLLSFFSSIIASLIFYTYWSKYRLIELKRFNIVLWNLTVFSLMMALDYYLGNTGISFLKNKVFCFFCALSYFPFLWTIPNLIHALIPNKKFELLNNVLLGVTGTLLFILLLSIWSRRFFEIYNILFFTFIVLFSIALTACIIRLIIALVKEPKYRKFNLFRVLSLFIVLVTAILYIWDSNLSLIIVTHYMLILSIYIVTNGYKFFINLHWRVGEIKGIDNSVYDTFTNREKNIVSYLIQGLSYKEIAEAAHISISTVKTHVYRIYQKADVNNRNALGAKLGFMVDPFV